MSDIIDQAATMLFSKEAQMKTLTEAQIQLHYDIEAIKEALASGFVFPPPKVEKEQETLAATEQETPREHYNET